MWWLIKEHHDHGEQELEFHESESKQDTIEWFIQWLIDEQDKLSEKKPNEPDFDIY
jgi:hypothetical protein